MSRRSSSALTDFLQDIADDIKDFIDDEIVDRGRDTERDLRRAGRNWYDDDDDDDNDRRGRRRGGRRRGSDDDLEELRDAVRFLTRQVDGLAKSGGSRSGGSGRSATTTAEAPIAGYDDMNADEIVSRLPSLSQDELSEVASYERANQSRTTVLDRVESLQGDEPWSGYDDQTVAEVKKRLGSADEDAAREVRDYERRHKNRQGVLDATAAMLSS